MGEDKFKTCSEVKGSKIVPKSLEINDSQVRRKRDSGRKGKFEKIELEAETILLSSPKRAHRTTYLQKFNELESKGVLT